MLTPFRFSSKLGRALRLAGCSVVVSVLTAAPVQPGWIDPGRPLDDRAESIVAALTLAEKINLLSGGPGAVINATPRLGLPAVHMSDGPLGLKKMVEGSQQETVRSTSFPAGIALAATFDVPLARKIGRAIGQECRANGVDMLLGPSVNIYRVPQCGRNFEYYGEDPLLAADLAVGFTLGLQSQGVIGTVKHFAANNQEYDRYRGNSIVDERTLNEIYFPAFRAAVERGGIWAVMTAHNPLNGIHCSDNAWLLNDVLRGQWGFKGFVVSDWNSTYETVPVVKGGVDLEMPMPKTLAPARIEAALKTGEITEAMLDAKVRRIVRACLALGIYGPGRPSVDPVDDEANYHLAVAAARESVVLLKNRAHFLPLQRGRTRRLVVLGKLARETPHHGGGAASVPARRKQSLLDDIRTAAGSEITVEHFDSVESAGAKDACTSADAVLVAAGFPAEIEGEAHDRPFDLLPDQVALIRAATAANARTVVVLITGGGVNISPWLDPVAALVHAWYLGDGCGHVIGDLLFGDLNPSGRLPISLERTWADSPASANYDVTQSEQLVERLFKPAYEAKHGIVAPRDFFPISYAEGIFVGYRHYDAKEIAPLFPFGFGLSYTTFRYETMEVKKHNGRLEVSANITNTGDRAGSEVVQLYVGARRPRLPRPVRELKGFTRVALQPGETRPVSFALTDADFAFFDPEARRWLTEPGGYEISVAASSRNLCLTQTIKWPQ